MEKKRPRSFGTHNGTFHADEVTACALLLLFDLIDPDKIVRSRDAKVLSECEYVCDVGGVYDPKAKCFDHHQADYQGLLSSAGMILLYLLSTGHISSNEYQFLNHSIVMGVDAHDIGRAPQIPGLCSFSHLISNFTPISHEVSEEEQTAAFHEAMQFTLGHLKRMWQRYLYGQSCREIVADAMSKNNECLIFEKAIPWFDAFFELGGATHPATFMIMPSGKHWKLRGIPPSYDERMKVRHYLPEEWAGYLEEELKQISGIPGAIFCHKGRFISVWETREDAIKAWEYVRRKRDYIQKDH